MDVKLMTARLVLRPLAADDIGGLVGGLNDYEVARYLTVVPYPYSEADARHWIGEQTPPVPRKAVFAIDLAGVGMIGSVSLDRALGYWLDRRHHGRGYMTEGAEALLAWHFAALPDDVVASGAHVGNGASLRVQEKLGFVDTGARDMPFVRSQQRKVEHIQTQLTRRRFEAARQRLGGS